MKALFAVFTVNAVVSQLLLRQGLHRLGGANSFSGLPSFIGKAAFSPWIYGSLTLQVLSYVLWMMIVSREKLGVAAASVGAGFYVLLALSAWLVYGETLSALQWAGIVLVSVGVMCITLVPV